MKRFAFLMLGIVLLVSLVGTTIASAKDSFPQKPIQMIVPWSAGGGTDRIARMFDMAMEKYLDTSIEVVNRPGGGGAVGHLAGAKAKADGYTMTFATVDFAMFQAMDLVNISYNDFNSVALINLDPMAIAVKADALYETIEDLIAAIKENPGMLRASGAGYGGINDLARAGWVDKMGLPVNALPWIPSAGGSATAIQELVAGGIDIVITSLAELRPMTDAGRIRPLAVMGEERSLDFPEVKTLKEVGIDWVIGTWRALVVPDGIPESTLAVLREAAKKACKDPEFVEFMKANNFSILYKNGAECNAFMKEQQISLSKLLSLLKE